MTKKEWEDFVKRIDDIDYIKIEIAIYKLAEYEDLEEQKQ